MNPSLDVGVRCRLRVVRGTQRWPRIIHAITAGLVALAGSQLSLGGEPALPAAGPKRMLVDRTAGTWTGTAAISAVFGAAADGSVLAIRSQVGVRLIEPLSGLVTRDIPVPSVAAVAISSHGELLVVGMSEGQVRAYELPSGTVKWGQRVQGRINALRVSPDGSRLAVLATDRHVVILSTTDGTRLSEVPLAVGEHLVEWAGRGGELILGEGPRVVRAGGPDLGTLDEVATMPSDIRALAVEPGGAWIAWGCKSGAVQVRVESGGRVVSLRPPDGSAVLSLAPLSTTEVCVSTASAVETWSLGSPAGHPVLGLVGSFDITSTPDFLFACDILRDEIRVVRLAAGPKPIMQRWERRPILSVAATANTVAFVRPGGVIERWSNDATPERRGEVSLSTDGVTLSPDAAVAAAALEGQVALFDATTGRRVKSITGGFSGDRLRFSPSGSHIARWVPSSGLIVGRVGVGLSRTDDGSVFPVSVSIADFQFDERRGNVLLGTMDGVLTSMNESGRDVYSVSAGCGVSRVAAVRDGAVLCACDNGTVVRWVPESGVVQRTATKRAATRLLAISPSGAVAVVVSTDGDVTMLDCLSLTTIAETVAWGGAISAALEDDTHVWIGSREGVVYRLAIGCSGQATSHGDQEPNGR